MGLLCCVPFNLLGQLVAVYFAYCVLHGIYKFFLRPGKDLRKYGKWAVITGATDGIGKAYAFEMAQRGINVLLISRTQSKLDAVKEEVEAKGVQADTLSVDFTDFGPDSENYARVLAKTRGLDIGVLVNNVGMSYPFPKLFTEIDDALIANMITCNVQSVTWMTRAVLPGMTERGRGAIINISSGLGRIPAPLLCMYSATKAFVEKFSQALDAENSKISVQCQSPMYVSTKLAKIRHSSLMVPSPKGYARAGTRCIGYESQISPYWAHGLQQFVMDWLPESVLCFISNKNHRAIRKKGLAKEARKAAEAAAARS